MLPRTWIRKQTKDPNTQTCTGMMLKLPMQQFKQMLTYHDRLMLSGGLSWAIDNRSLADDPETPRRMELSKTGGRMEALPRVCIHLVCGRDISLSGFYFYQLTDMIHTWFVPSLLNKSHTNTDTPTHTHTPTHTYKQNCAGQWTHSTSSITNFVWLPALNLWPPRC